MDEIPLLIQTLGKQGLSTCIRRSLTLTQKEYSTLYVFKVTRTRQEKETLNSMNWMLWGVTDNVHRSRWNLICEYELKE